ncbi:MAG: hypothetical protein A3G73_06055 [Rhodospirillales bacterium RIFCSPLOWO2_12_FULL_67_15]|nr:MAG: hypothetical protein A3G73_06055 [Rhodospirillales bacterium RIFCSPLOWO2_12_FULL_67_15]
MACARLRVASQLVEHERKLACRIHKPGVTRYRRAIAFDRLLKLAACLAGITDLEPRRSRLRLELERAAARAFRLGVATQLGERSSQIAMGGGTMRCKMYRQLEAVGGVLEATQLEMHEPQLVVRLAAIMPELDRTCQGALCLLVLRALALRCAETQQFGHDSTLRDRRGSTFGDSGGGVMPPAPAPQNSAEIHGTILPYYPRTRDVRRAAPASCSSPITAF